MGTQTPKHPLLSSSVPLDSGTWTRLGSEHGGSGGLLGGREVCFTKTSSSHVSSTRVAGLLQGSPFLCWRDYLLQGAPHSQRGGVLCFRGLPVSAVEMLAAPSLCWGRSLLMGLRCLAKDA